MEMEFDNAPIEQDIPAYRPAAVEPDRMSNASRASNRSAVKSKLGKGKGKKVKPAWATTQKTQEEDKEAEIDNLLEFAYDLDYDKFMDDFEVR